MQLVPPRRAHPRRPVRPAGRRHGRHRQTKFKTITGGTDADGAFVPASSTCTNVDCHSGATPPGWYYVPDTAAPAWSPNSGIAAANPNQGGVLNVTWNAAADAYPSDPVSPA